jgi:hypothetical protein
MYRKAIFLFVLLLMPLSAWSQDLVATWQHKGQTSLVLAVRDDNHIRMNISDDNYALVADAKIYMITKSDDQWNAMDMDQLSGLASGLQRMQGAAVETGPDYRTRIKTTGRTERVAGYNGTVYSIETTDASGRVIDTTEAVFCDHADIKRINRAWQTIAMRMATILGQDTAHAIANAAGEAESSGVGGVLRIGEMKLNKVEKPALEASYFDLPPNARLVNVGTLPPQDSADTASEGDPRLAEEVAREAGQTAQDEVKRQTIDEVKKGVGNVFKKLF